MRAVRASQNLKLLDFLRDYVLSMKLRIIKTGSRIKILRPGETGPPDVSFRSSSMDVEELAKG